MSIELTKGLSDGASHEDGRRMNVVKHSGLLGDLVKYLPGQIVPAIVGFLCTPVFTRIFTPEAYGDYFLVNSTANLVAILGSWLTISMVRFFPAYEMEGRAEGFHNTVIAFNLVWISALAIGWGSVLMLFRAQMPAALHSLMWLGVLVFVGGAFYKLLLELLRIKRRVSAYSTFSACNVVGTSICGLILAVTVEPRISSLLWGSLVAAGIMLPILWLKLDIKLRLSWSSISVDLIKNMTKYGLPLIIGNLGAWILGMSDRFVLKAVGTSHDVGIYSASYAVAAQTVTLLTTLFGLASGTLVYRIYEREGAEPCRAFCAKVLRYYLIICLPAVAGLAILAKPAARLLFGSAFVEGYKIIGPISFGVFVLGLQQLYYPSFHITKRTHLTMVALLGASCAKVMLTLILVPRFAYSGAAWATTASYCVLLVIVLLMARRQFYWPFPFATLRNVLCSLFIMSVVVTSLTRRSEFPLGLMVVSGVIVGIVTYALSLLLFKEIGLRALREIWSGALGADQTSKSSTVS